MKVGDKIRIQLKEAIRILRVGLIGLFIFSRLGIFGTLEMGKK